MKFKMLSGNEVKPVVANKYKAKQHDGSYSETEYFYSVSAGSRGEQLWEFMVTLSKNYFGNINTDTIVLDKDNYNFVPIKDKTTRKVKVDKYNNTRYMLIQDNTSYHKKDLALIWEIPNTNYIDVKYEIEGNANTLSKGYVGRERGNTIYKSPILLLELLGDCKLTYIAKNDSGEIFKQTFTYDYNKELMNIGLVEHIEEENID